MKQYSIEEIRRHNNLSSAWITVKNDVLDVTQFITNHPGGEDVMIPYLGGDATKAFYEDIAHSDNAIELIQKLKIGYLSKQDEKNKVKSNYDMQINWDKPVVFQVGHLGKDYQKWVHTPIHTNDPVNLLGGFLENFTKCYWFIPLVFWVPVIIGELYYSLFVLNEYSKPVCIFVFIMGCCLWPLFEYCLHRFIYHMHTDTYWANTLHFLLHGVHHLTPMDKTRLVAPPPLSSAIYIILSVIFYPVMPCLTFYLSLAAGVMTGYLVYDEMHFYLHHGVNSKSPLWLQRLKTHHNDHHYKNPELFYGVSNSFTDELFNTMK
eukprot:TRINITY_DN13788_c0_g1_i1.p1 TRINITY_DN13788_c0_g1~~TRINITY_DN13788_c0_g1_i1.p1  ORF type:complete len:319 (-),score=60.18 TRINITY_DN13788_c0_g1_i1:32-988(-)